MNNVARAKSVSRGTGHWTTTVPQLDTWLEGSSTSLDLILEVSSIKDSEILDLDITNNSDIVVVSTVEELGSQYIRNLFGSHLPSWLWNRPNQEYFCSSAAIRRSINLCAFAASGPHRQCATPCHTECRCSSRVPVTVQGQVFRHWREHRWRQPLSRATLFCQWQVHRFSVRARLILVHTWLLQLGQCICVVTCLGPR